MSLIEASHVSLDFPLYHGNARSVKRAFLSAASRGRLGQDAKKRVVVQALRDVSFTLRTGDRLGLVGNNGAGKTTLLRALAGIYEPVAGEVRVQGSLNALIDPNLGMNPDLTGRENIMLRGMYSGLDRQQVAALEEDVQEFADLGDFMDLAVRIYSSGMIVRLGFALATAIKPQLLLMDEWFLAGDYKFMQKARTRIESMVSGADILVLSSHAHGIIASWCTRVIWMEDGRIREDGDPKEVLEHYLGHPVKPSTTLDGTDPDPQGSKEPV